ncbi:MAG: Rieske (2Fe-2S) protein [Candidatus Dormibacteria bacterium]
MVFRKGIQVNRNAFSSAPKKWSVVAAEGEVTEVGFIRRQAGRQKVLLRRSGGENCDAGAICSHADGPLDELPLQEGQLHCPWHGSQFDLRSGRPPTGPR